MPASSARASFLPERGVSRNRNSRGYVKARGPSYRISPDGRYLCCVRKRGGFQYNASFPLWQIARRDLKTGDEDVLTQDLGSIEPGKLADLVVLARNPLDNIRNTNSIRYVMKNGELFEGDTLNQLWPVEKKLPPLWWWNDAPKD